MKVKVKKDGGGGGGGENRRISRHQKMVQSGCDHIDRAFVFREVFLVQNFKNVKWYTFYDQYLN